MKSRFSHRQIHLCPKFSLKDYVAIFQMYLRLPDDIDADADFINQWNSRVEVCNLYCVSTVSLQTVARHSLVMTQCSHVKD